MGEHAQPPRLFATLEEYKRKHIKEDGQLTGALYSALTDPGRLECTCPCVPHLEGEDHHTLETHNALSDADYLSAIKRLQKVIAGIDESA